MEVTKYVDERDCGGMPGDGERKDKTDGVPLS